MAIATCPNIVEDSFLAETKSSFFMLPMLDGVRGRLTYTTRDAAVGLE